VFPTATECDRTGCPSAFQQVAVTWPATNAVECQRGRTARGEFDVLAINTCLWDIISNVGAEKTERDPSTFARPSKLRIDGQGRKNQDSLHAEQRLRSNQIGATTGTNGVQVEKVVDLAKMRTPDAPER